MKKKKLILTTGGYPNNLHDSMFIMPEIECLANSFDVIVVCLQGYIDGKNERKDIRYFYYDEKLGLYRMIKYFIGYLTNIECAKERDIIRNKTNNIYKKLLMNLCSFITYSKAEAFISYLKREGILPLNKTEDAIYYTYWNNYASLAMAMHKDEYINVKCISRLHGCDLYDERYTANRQPFKELINEFESKLFFVGKKPLEYYINRHPELNINKCVIAKLGTPAIKMRAESESDCFRLVSCSHISKEKRVDLIVKALTLIDFELEWIHFGGELCENEIRELAHRLLDSKKNIKWNITGIVQNELIRQYYENNYVDAFITTSETEGAPVSIMEAMSVGIPIIGTDVGDIANMIKECGIILNKDVKFDEVAEAIVEFYYNRTKAFVLRENAYKRWNEDYNCNKNAEQLCQEILEI